MQEKNKMRNKRKKGKRMLALLLAFLLVSGTWNPSWVWNAYAQENTVLLDETETEKQSEAVTEQSTENNPSTQSEDVVLMEDETEATTEVTPKTVTENTETLQTEESLIIEDNQLFAAQESAVKTITNWQWTGNPDELEIQQDEETGIWGLGLPGVTIDNQADFDTVVSMLPASITATVTDTFSAEIVSEDDNNSQTEELPITWSCDTYRQDENGNWPVSGDYTFQADLPEGYTLAEGQEKMEVVLQLGETVLYENNAGDFNVTGGTKGTDWEYESTAKTLTFKTSGTYTVTGNGNPTTERIIVSGNNIDATIILNNVNIDVFAIDGTPAFFAKDQEQTNVKLVVVLKETNILKSGRHMAGITWNNTDVNSILEIKGEGSLTAISNYNGAGIGSGASNDAANITISGGIVTATGGSYGAGIGSGAEGFASNITISGGTVTATGGQGAGIGCGSDVYSTGNKIASKITISGGTVTATGTDGSAGIGGGWGVSASDITINGGTVIATGDYSAGIGGGFTKSGTDITINGGTVTAIGTNGGADIGSGAQNNGSQNIKITNGSVKASSIGPMPTDGSGNSVYLAKLENLSGTNSVSVNNKTYTRNGDHPDDGAFYLYLIGGNDYEITVSGIKYSVKWNGSDAFTVQQPSPTPTISNVSGTANSITVSLSGYDTKYGYAQYACIKTGDTLSESEWKSVTDSSYTFIDRESETFYTCYVRFAGNANYFVSEVVSKEFTTNAIIPYMDVIVTENGQVTMVQKPCDNYLVLDEDTLGSVTLGTADTTTWYVVDGDVDFTNANVTDKRLTVKGDVHLILKDGCKLTAPGGITVNSSSDSLTIYGQTLGTGTLMAGEATTTNRSGIGGGDGQGGGNITINGGKVTAIGGENGAGIGSGNMRTDYNKTTAVITINGGEVTASAKLNPGNSEEGYYREAAGIGGGFHASSGIITINGGTVEATSGRHGAGIGAGWYGNVDTITINGGNITARTGGGGGVSIGHGNNGTGGTIFINSRATITMEDWSNDPKWDWKKIETLSGVVYTDKIGIFNGTELIADLTVPKDYTLTVPKGSSLTIPSGKTLTNNGTIANSGTINKKGNLTNNGTISYPVTLVAGDTGISGFQTSKDEQNFAPSDLSFTAYYETDLYIKATLASNYTFAKWDNDSTDVVYYIRADNYNPVSLTAYSKGESYIITYKDKDDKDFTGTFGSTAKPDEHIYGTATALVRPTRADYIFDGWYIESNCSGTAITELAATGYTDNITLYAKWTPITYNITIPSTVNAGGDAVSITASNLTLGTGGEVHVKANYGTGYDINSVGILTLKRKDVTNDTIASQMYLGENEFKDLTQDVAVFTESSKDPVSVKFGAPSTSDGSTIPAGDYSGTVTFQFIYDEQQ